MLNVRFTEQWIDEIRAILFHVIVGRKEANGGNELISHILIIIITAAQHMHTKYM